MQDDPFYSTALAIAKSRSYGSDEYLEDITQDILSQIHEYINVELLRRLSPDQFAEFEKILENTPPKENEIVEFTKKHNIDINDVTTVALTNFRIAYIGR